MHFIEFSLNYEAYFDDIIRAQIGLLASILNNSLLKQFGKCYCFVAITAVKKQNKQS